MNVGHSSCGMKESRLGHVEHAAFIKKKPLCYFLTVGQLVIGLTTLGLMSATTVIFGNLGFLFYGGYGNG